MKTKKQTKLTKNLQKKPKSTPSSQTFGDHIAEIRRRLFVVGVFFLLGATAAYYFKQALLSLILAPLHGQQLVYLTPGGGFSFIFQIVMYAGFIVAAPVLVYQIHAFIKPAMPQRAQKSVLRLTLLSTLLLCGGITYGYYVAIPAAIEFLSTFAEGVVAPNLTAESYLSFFLAYVGGLALLSLIPLVVIFRHWINPLTPGGVMRSEQWVVLIAFILAAIITPTPDAFNQLMIAAPVITIYQIGVVSVLVSIHRERKAERLQMAHSRVITPINPSILADQEDIEFTQAVIALTSPTTSQLRTPERPETSHETPRISAPKQQPMSGFMRPARPQRTIDSINRPIRTAPSFRPRLSVDGFVRS